MPWVVQLVEVSSATRLVMPFLVPSEVPLWAHLLRIGQRRTSHFAESQHRRIAHQRRSLAVTPRGSDTTHRRTLILKPMYRPRLIYTRALFNIQRSLQPTRLHKSRAGTTIIVVANTSTKTRLHSEQKVRTWGFIRIAGIPF